MFLSIYITGCIGGIVFSALAIVLSAYMFIELRFIKKRRIVDVEDILED